MPADAPIPSESYTLARNDRYLKPREAGHRRGRVWPAQHSCLVVRPRPRGLREQITIYVYTYLCIYTYIYTSLGYIYRERERESRDICAGSGSKTIRPRRISRSIRSLGPQSWSRYCTQFILRFFIRREREESSLARMREIVDLPRHARKRSLIISTWGRQRGGWLRAQFLHFFIPNKILYFYHVTYKRRNTTSRTTGHVTKSR